MNPSDKEGPPVRRRGRQQEQTPVQRALGLLTRREHSRKELTRKLTARGVAGDDAA
ncbi:MAG TPA: recombination regulator RecX, partial [Pseudoxanthomonas sp.]|nr:recombination regulator RecX [Pseudoxanthomonas sp.]